MLEDSNNHCVQVFSQNGRFLRTFGKRGSGPGELSYPWVICVDHDYVYVVEEGNHRVSVFYTSGEFITLFGKEGSGEGELSNPHGFTCPLAKMDSCMCVTVGIFKSMYTG